MVRLFVSDRIFCDGRFYSGAIAVRNDGKIDELLKSRTEIDEWLTANSHVEVMKKPSAKITSKFIEITVFSLSHYYRLSIILDWL